MSDATNETRMFGARGGGEIGRVCAAGGYSCRCFSSNSSKASRNVVSAGLSLRRAMCALLRS